MPNGKPGDGPFSDIVVHELDYYSPTIDALVREIAGMATEEQRRELGDLLYFTFNPIHDPDLEELERILTALRDKLAGESGGPGAGA